MPIERYSTEQIITKLRQGEVELGRAGERFTGDGGYGSRGCTVGADESTCETKGPV